MLKDLLEKEKSAVLEKWFRLTIDMYPAETKTFLTANTNRFTNPVRSALLVGLEGIYDNLVQDRHEAEAFNDFLDKIIRVRAVQDFAPAEALAFVFYLKHVVREVLAKDIETYKLFEELLTFESRVDRLGLLAFNLYTQCRHTVSEVRIAELKRTYTRFFERVCQKYGMPEDWEHPEDQDTTAH
jgi:hypothetical protein